MDVSRRCRDLARSELTFSSALVLIVILLRPQGVMAIEDSAAYFNYYNNIADVSPVPGVGWLFFYQGYAALCPQLTAFLASALPFQEQMLVYVGVSFSFGVFFMFQLTQVIGNTIRIRWLAYGATSLFALVVLLHKGLHTEGTNYFVNLTYTIWLGLMGFYFRVVNIYLGKPFKPLWFGFCTLSILSHPLCFCALPVLVLFCVLYRERGRGILLECGSYIALLVLYALYLVRHDDSVRAPLSATLHSTGETLQYFRQYLAPALSHSAGLAMLICTLFLAAAAALSTWRIVRSGNLRDPGSIDALIPLVAYFGLAPTILFMLSNRLAEYHAFVEGRYVLPALFSALLVAVLSLARYRPSPVWLQRISWVRTASRKMVISCAVGITGIVFAGLAFALDRPLRHVDAFVARYQFFDYSEVVSRYRFLASGATFRHDCHAGAMAYEWERWSTIILCKPDARQIGALPITAYTRSIAVWNESPVSQAVFHPPEETPVLVVRQPVFPASAEPSSAVAE